MRRLVAIERWLCLAGMAAAGTLLLALVAFSGAAVALRAAGRPFSGAYELSGLAGALIASLALADTQRKRGHVELDMFTRKYRPGARRALGFFNTALGFLVTALLAVQLSARASRLLAAGELSETLRLPYPWLMHACAAALGLFACAYLTDAVYLLTRRDPDTEAFTREGRKGVVTSIRDEVEPPAGADAALPEREG